MSITFRILLRALLLAGIVTTCVGQTVSTDKPDYAPGETVAITGSGFASGETVRLQILNLTDPSDTGPEHDPWTVTADGSGNISTSWLVTSDEGGATLQLTARGLTSGLTAQTTFTDSASVAGVAVGSASTNATYGTVQSITYVVTITATGSGNGSSTPAVTGLPTGVTGVFNPVTVNLRDVNSNPGSTTNITLTITTIATTAPVTNTFTVTAQPSPLVATNGTLIVNRKALTAVGTLSVPSSKTYDGTTAVTVSGAAALQSAEIIGTGAATDGKPYTGDTVSLTGTAAYVYNGKDVSTATTVTESGLSLTGAQATNYTLTAPSFAASITARAVVLTGTRAYDGTTTAAFGILSVSNAVSGDAVSVGSGSGTLASTNVGSRAITSFGTLALSNNAAGDYTLAGASGNVTITAVPVTVTADAKTKVYGNTDPALTSQITSGALVGSDSLSGSLTRVAGTNVGNYAILQGTLTAGGNYTLSYVSSNLTITTRPITVTADAKTKVYGSSDPTLTSQITSGSLVTGDSLGGSLTRVAGTNVGTYTIQQGTLTAGSNYNLTYVSANLSLTALPVVLTGTRAYDGTTTAAFGILSVSNKVSGDTVSVGSGAGTLASANVGSRSITSFGTLALGNNSAGNYTLTGASGLVTITQAGSSVAIVSSKNPSGFNDSINFTGTVTSGATGSVAFLTNNAPFSTNTLSGNSAASPSLSTLPRGTNLITAVYVGDANYLASTNSLNQVVTNHPPAVNTMTISRTAGLGCKFSLAELGTNWSDIDGDTVTLSHLNLTTSNGVTLVTNGNFIIYANNPNVTDQITYTVTDGHGATNSGVVNITVNAFVTGSQGAQMFFSSNSANLKMQGIPGYTYTIQRNTNLSSGLGWVSVLTNTAASSNGVMNATDNFNDLGHVAPASAYYRLLWHP